MCTAEQRVSLTITGPGPSFVYLDLVLFRLLTKYNLPVVVVIVVVVLVMVVVLLVLVVIVALLV